MPAQVIYVVGAVATVAVGLAFYQVRAILLYLLLDDAQ
jgi:hypothetical protein